MNQLVQSAVTTATKGNKTKAIDMLIQALKSAPGDMEAWLALADLTDDPKYKRQCLNRVLSLDPTHPAAREKLLQLDRAAMGGRDDSIPTRPAPSQSSFSTASPKIKPLFFRMPLLTRLSFYLITVLGLVMTVSMLTAREGGLTLMFLISQTIILPYFALSCALAARTLARVTPRLVKYLLTFGA